jgi:hypothetical protein
MRCAQELREIMKVSSMTRSVVNQKFHLAISSVHAKRSMRAGGDKGSSQTRVVARATDGIGAPTKYEMTTAAGVGRVLIVTVSGVSVTTRVMQVQNVSAYSTAPAGMNIRRNRLMQPTLTEKVVKAVKASPVVHVSSVRRMHVLRLQSGDHTGPIWRQRYSTVVRQVINRKHFAVQSRQPHVKNTIG